MVTYMEFLTLFSTNRTSIIATRLGCTKFNSRWPELSSGRLPSEAFTSGRCSTTTRARTTACRAAGSRFRTATSCTSRTRQTTSGGKPGTNVIKLLLAGSLMLRLNEAAFTQAIMQHALSIWKRRKNMNEIAWPSQGNLSEGGRLCTVDHLFTNWFKSAAVDIETLFTFLQNKLP